MDDPQLEALGILFPALEENQELTKRVREKHDIWLPEDKRERQLYIKQIPMKVWAAVEAECLEHVGNLSDLEDARLIFEPLNQVLDKPEIKKTIAQSEHAVISNGKVYLEFEAKLAKNLAHYILTDTWLPFPEAAAGEILEIKEEDGSCWFLASVGPFTDINAFTDRLKKKFKKRYNVPKAGAREYLRNARYFSFFKMRKTDAEIADLELESELGKLKIDLHSPEYEELHRKTKEKIRKARRQFYRQFKALVDT